MWKYELKDDISEDLGYQDFLMFWMCGDVAVLWSRETQTWIAILDLVDFPAKLVQGDDLETVLMLLEQI